MSCRSPPQRDIDDRAFPIRVKVRVPPTGLGRVLTEVELWLAAEVFPGEYAHHNSQTLGGDAMAFFFRRIGDAARFLEAFPMLELADGTTSPAHTSPLFPHGRGGGQPDLWPFHGCTPKFTPNLSDESGRRQPWRQRGHTGP